MFVRGEGSCPDDSRTALGETGTVGFAEPVFSIVHNMISVIDDVRSFMEDVVDCFKDIDNPVASFDFPSHLLGGVADARPAVLSGAEEVFKAVDVCSLILTLLLGSFVTILVG